MTAFGNFGTISIYRQRLKLETSKLACRMIIECIIVKNEKNVSKAVSRGSRDHLWELWDPLHISATAEARNSKFRMQIDHEA